MLCFRACQYDVMAHCDVFFGCAYRTASSVGDVDQPSGYPARLPKEQVFAKLFQVLQTVSVIQKANGDVEVVSGSAQPITVTVAKLKGREKYMTTVARLQVRSSTPLR